MYAYILQPLLLDLKQHVPMAKYYLQVEFVSILHSQHLNHNRPVERDKFILEEFVCIQQLQDQPVELVRFCHH